MKIQIFEAERNLGLEKTINAKGSITYLTPIIPSKNVYTSKASTDNSDPLLYKITDILASTGWNLNEDVFDPYELYSARLTPVNKPFDIEHEESNIIGHIVGSRCVTADMDDDNSDYAELDEDLSLDMIPPRFHVLNDSVIYKTWSDDDKMKATEDMIAEIEDGKWFVSMECKFSGFDYSVVNPEGDVAVIPRTEDTAFLTKYLRAYGGEGTYCDKANGSVYKVGRMMKNIIFSGKGLVKKPANPDSVIINKQENVQASENKVYDNTVDVMSNINKENNMGDELKELQAKVDLLVQDKANLVKELDSIKASKNDETIASLKSEIEQLKIQLDVHAKASTQSAKANDELTQKLEDAELELSKVRAEKKKFDRTKKMKDAGADDEDIEATLAQLDPLTEDQFDALLTTLAKTLKSKKAAPQNPNDVSDNPSSYSSTAGQTLIDNAKREETPNLAVTPEPKMEATRASISERMLSRIKNKK